MGTVMPKTKPILDGFLAGFAASNLIDEHDPNRGSKATAVGLMAYFRQAQQAKVEEESERRARATENAQRLHNQEVEANLDGIRGDLAQLQDATRQEEYRRGLATSVRQRIARAEKMARRLKSHPEDNEALLVLFVQSKNMCLEADDADLALDEIRAVEKIVEFLDSQDAGLLTRISEFDRAATDFANCLTGLQGLVEPPWENESDLDTDNLIALRKGLSSIADDVHSKVDRAKALGVVVFEGTNFRFTAQAMRLLSEGANEQLFTQDGNSDYTIPDEKKFLEIERNIDNTLKLRTIRKSADSLIAGDVSLDAALQFQTAVESLDDVIGAPLRDRYGPQLTWLKTSANLMKEGACDLERLIIERVNADKAAKEAIDKSLREKAQDIGSTCKSQLKAWTSNLIKSHEKQVIMQPGDKHFKGLDEFVASLDELVGKVVKIYCESAVTDLRKFNRQVGELKRMKGKTFVALAWVLSLTVGLLGFLGMLTVVISKPEAFQEQPFHFIFSMGVCLLFISVPFAREYFVEKHIRNRLQPYFGNFNLS